MADLKDRLSRRWDSHIAEKFDPPSFWTQDSKGNDFLDIHLPGFKHEEVRIELAPADHIKIEAERIVNENKCIYIDHTFPLPENSDIENILGKFEGEHLHITVPKIVVGENKKEDSQNRNGNGNGSTAEEISKDGEESKNKGENQRKHQQGLDAAMQSRDSNEKGKSNETCRVASFSKKTIEEREEKDSQLQNAIKYLKRNKGDSKGNDFLGIHLPGFKHEEVRIGVASADHIKIEGERIVNESKCIYIDHTFPLPENSDIENILGKFEGEHLQITVPKIVVEENKEEDSENRNGNGNGNGSTAEEISQDDEESKNNGENQRKHQQGLDAAIQSRDSNKKGKSNETCRVVSFSKETIKKREEKDRQLQNAIKYLERNKGVLLSVIISFWIGVWVSKHRIESPVKSDSR
ncbi:hypothetical protein CRYUN_Cryun19dG0043300 [Craigia yunnanensis]